VSSAAGSGSDNPFAGYDVLPVHSIHDNQSGAVFHILDEYVESVCIEEHQGGDVAWSEDVTSCQSSVHEDNGSSHSTVVGITPTELEYFNELIKFDHMYFRQPSTDADMHSSEKSLNQSETDSCEVVSELTCRDEMPELASDEDLNLSSFSESDLAQLTNCLDWLIDSSGDMLNKSKDTISKCQDNTSCLGSLDDVESASLPEYIDSLTSFTDDSFISTIPFDCSIDKQNSHNSTFGLNFEKTSVENLLQNSELESQSKVNRMPNDVANKKYNDNGSTVFINSLMNCPSPSSSSGCESDFSSSTYDDEHFSFSTDIGLMDLSDEPFTELFPALY